jgi:hypothetical protein
VLIHPAAESTILPDTPVNTDTDSSLIIVPTGSTLVAGTLGTANSGTTLATAKSGSTTHTGLLTTTEVIFAGGTPVTSVMTYGAASATAAPSKHLSPPAIAGAVVGAIGGTAAFFLLLVLFVRWRKHVKDNKRASHGGESIKALHTGPAPMMAHNSMRYTTMFPPGGPSGVADDDASGRVAFLPAGATGFLNRAPGSPLASGSPLRANSPLSQGGPDPATAEGSQTLSERTIPTQSPAAAAAAVPTNRSGEVAFLAADASGWLNRNSSGPLQGQSTDKHNPMPNISASQSVSTIPSQPPVPTETSGAVAFLPAGASGWLNRNSSSPLQAGPPYEQISAPPSADQSFHKLSGYKVPSQFDTDTQAGLPSTNFAAAAAGSALAPPAAAHIPERASGATATNQLLNENPERFDSDYHDSGQSAAAAVAAAAARSKSPVSRIEPSFSSDHASEVDDMLGGPLIPRRSPERPSGPFAPPDFGSSANTSPNPVGSDHIAEQDFGVPHTTEDQLRPSPARTPDVREVPPPAVAPSGDTYNSPWGPSDAEASDQQSWYMPNSPEAPQAGGRSSTQFMSWPKPPEMRFADKKVRPKGI